LRRLWGGLIDTSARLLNASISNDNALHPRHSETTRHANPVGDRIPESAITSRAIRVRSIEEATQSLDREPELRRTWALPAPGGALVAGR